MFASAAQSAALLVDDDVGAAPEVSHDHSESAPITDVTAAPDGRVVVSEQAVQKDFWDLSRQGFDAIVHAQKCLLPPNWLIRRTEMPTRFAELGLVFADVEAPMPLSDQQRQLLEVPGAVVYFSNRVAVNIEYECDPTKRRKAGKDTPIEDDMREFTQYILQLMDHCQAESPLYTLTFAQTGTRIEQCVLDFHADFGLAHRILRVLMHSFSTAAFFVEPSLGPTRPRYNPNATLMFRDFMIDNRVETAPRPSAADCQSGLLRTAHSYTKDEGLTREALRMFVNLGISQMDIRSQSSIGGVELANVIAHPTDEGTYYVACGTPALPFALFSHCPSISRKLQAVLFERFGVLVTVAPCDSKFDSPVNAAPPVSATPLELPPMPPTTVYSSRNEDAEAAARAEEEDDPLEALYSESAPPLTQPVDATAMGAAVTEAPITVLDENGNTTEPTHNALGEAPEYNGFASQQFNSAPPSYNQYNAFLQQRSGGILGALPTLTFQHPSTFGQSAPVLSANGATASSAVATKQSDEDAMFDFGLSSAPKPAAAVPTTKAEPPADGSIFGMPPPSAILPAYETVATTATPIPIMQAPPTSTPATTEMSLAALRPVPVAPSSGFRMVKKPPPAPKADIEVRPPSPEVEAVTVRVGALPVAAVVLPPTKVPVVDIRLDMPDKPVPPSQHYLTIPERNVLAKRGQALSETFDHASQRHILLTELRMFLSAPLPQRFWLDASISAASNSPEATKLAEGVSKRNPHMVAAVSKPPPPPRRAYAPVPPNSEMVNDTAATETREFEQYVKYDALVRDYPPSMIASLSRWWHLTCHSLLSDGTAGSYLLSSATLQQFNTIRDHLKLPPIPKESLDQPAQLAAQWDARILESPLPLVVASDQTHPHSEVTVDVCSVCNEGYNETASRGRGGRRGGRGRWVGNAVGLPPAPLTTVTPTSQERVVWLPAPYPPHGAPFDTHNPEGATVPSFSVGISNSHGIYYFKSNGAATYRHAGTDREFYATPQAVLFNHWSAMGVVEEALEALRHLPQDSEVTRCFSDDELVTERGARVMRKKNHPEVTLGSDPGFTVPDTAIVGVEGMDFASINEEEKAAAMTWNNIASKAGRVAPGNRRERAAADTAFWAAWGKPVASLVSRAAAKLASFEAAQIARLYESNSSPPVDAIAATREKILLARAQYRVEVTTLLLAYFKGYLQLFTLAVTNYAYHLSDRGYLRRTKCEFAKKSSVKSGAKRPRPDEAHGLVAGSAHPSHSKYATHLPWALDHLTNNVSCAAEAREGKAQPLPTLELDGFELHDPRPVPAAELHYRDAVRKEQVRLHLKASEGTISDIKTIDHPSKAVTWSPGPTGNTADGGSGGLHVTLGKVLGWLVDQNVRHEVLDGYVMALLGIQYPTTLHGV